MGRGAWRAVALEVAKSWTRLSTAHKLCLRHMVGGQKMEAEDQTQRKVSCAADLEAGRKGDKQSGGW